MAGHAGLCVAQFSCSLCVVGMPQGQTALAAKGEASDFFFTARREHAGLRWVEGIGGHRRALPLVSVLL
jgi:hypothetical protein